LTQPLEWLAGNQPVQLDAGTRWCTVISGSFAVFAVDKETAERLHLFSVARGEPLLSIACPAGADWEIAAVPLEMSCLEAATGRRDRDETFAHENWLGKIGETLARFLPAGDQAEVLVAGRRLNLNAGQRVASGQGLLFLHLDSGEGIFGGTRVKPGSTLALTPGLWVEATGEAEWQAFETASLAFILATTEIAIAALFIALGEVRRQRETAERERFLARRELNARTAGSALAALAGTVHREQRGEAEHGSGDPLFDVIRAATATMGVTARPARSSGTRSDAVREIAQASGLRTRTVVLSGEWWRQENGPLVGHWTQGNAVALLPCRGGYEIFDPARGIRQRASRSNAGGLNAFAQMFYRPLPEDASPAGLLRHALSTPAARRDLRTVVIAGVGAAVLAMATPQGFAILIGQAIPDADSSMILQVGAGMIAAAFGSTVFLLTQAVAILRVQSGAFAALQTGAWDHLLKLSPAFFRDFTAGQLHVRVDAVTRIYQLLTADSLRSLFAGVASFVSLALMFWYSPALALIALGFGVAIILQTWLGARALLRVQQRWQHMEELLSGLVLQSIGAVSKLRVAGAGNRAFSQWAREYSRKQKLSLEIQELKDRMRLFNMVAPGLASAAALYFMLQEPVPLGPFLACNAAMTAFLAATAAASDSFSGLILVASLWRRLNTILAVKPEVDNSRIHPGRLRGAISVDSVTFRYRTDGPMILDGVSIVAAPGECIALTGPSGCGKTTLLNLVLRFETPHSGAIYLDGRELSSLDITAVRRQIGVVTQDGRIMSGSLFENICSGGVNTMDEAWEAARAAGLDEDIQGMPMGMHTIVSEGGGNLSGGQRQRVLIARALVLKPSILIFDEATSALDNRTQAIVTESLNRLKATRILVAHRLSTIRGADRIYVIEKGRVVQQGKFEELAAAPGMFATLVKRQTA